MKNRTNIKQNKLYNVNIVLETRQDGLPLVKLDYKRTYMYTFKRSRTLAPLAAYNFGMFSLSFVCVFKLD